MRRIVLFDLDGTLVDSLPGLHVALARMLSDYHLGSVTMEQTRGFIGEGAITMVSRALDAAGGEAVDVGEAARTFIVHYADTALLGTRLFDHAREALDALWHAGFPMALCTNKPQASTRTLITGLGISHYFQLVVAGDTLPVRKPHPEHLRFAIRYMASDDLHPAIMVGDSQIDLLAARAAGIPIALVSHGYATMDDTMRSADFVLDSLQPLPGLIMGLP